MSTLLVDELTEKTLEKGKRRAPKDYSHILPFMAPPVPSQSGRTAPELAYRAMGEAIEGLEPRDLRKLAPLIHHWKKLDCGRKSIAEECLRVLENEQENEERRWKYEREHPVIVFTKARARLR